MSNYRTRKDPPPHPIDTNHAEESQLLKTEDTSTQTAATIYVCATSGSPTGPFAWVARTVTPEGFSELAGHSEGNHFRLQVIAATEALKALPEGSTVRVVCSDQYLIDYVLKRLDAVLEGRIKGWNKFANLDLFPDLLKARDRHAKVSAEVVPWDRRDAEHEQAVASAQRVVDQVKAMADFGEPMPVHKARKAASDRVKPCEVKKAAYQVGPKRDALTEAPMKSDNIPLDLPWDA